MLARMFLALCSRFGPHGMPFGDEKPHGMPFEAGPLSPSHAVGERKRKSCGATSETKGADTRIFGEKGNCVARPLEILYFFVYQYRLNAPMGEVNRQ